MVGVYKEEGVELYLGDCMELLKDIPDNSVDLLLVDPPYGTIKGLVFDEERDGRSNYNKGDMDWDVVLPLDELFEEYRRIIRLKGRLVTFSQNKFTQEIRGYGDKTLTYVYPLYWKKNEHANFMMSNKAPLSYVEDLSVYTKNQTVGWGDDLGLKSYATDVVNYTGMNASGIHKEKGDFTLLHFFTKGVQFSLPRKENYMWLVEKFGIDKMDGYKTYEELEKKKSKTGFESTYNIIKGKHNPNWLEYDKDKKNVYHPTEKPVDLLRHIIKMYSNEGDLVLDNTMGSGSTGVAAKEEGRRFIGMELDEGYYKVAVNRIKDLKKGGNNEKRKGSLH